MAYQPVVSKRYQYKPETAANHAYTMTDILWKRDASKPGKESIAQAIISAMQDVAKTYEKHLEELGEELEEQRKQTMKYKRRAEYLQKNLDGRLDEYTKRVQP